MTNRTNKTRVLALMSGGVDSSTTAALLVRAGHEVAGVYLKLWEQSSQSEIRNSKLEIWKLGDSCWAREMRDAARVAAHLGIPFTVWDVTEDYKKRVLQNFYAEYAAGRTPNPDVLCNSEIKFGVALERALREGYEYMATGHYARLQEVTGGYKKLQGVALKRAVDTNKDQSYFLWRLTQEQLARVMFPIGEYTKPQVRQMAKKFGLHNADKKDSQGVCFLGKIDLKEFLRPVVAEKSGSIYDVRGNLIGFHDGLAHFTVGQRHGTNVGDGHGPYFVVGKDITTNTLIVAHELDEPQYRAIRCQVSGFRFQVEVPEGGLRCMARTRYRAPLCEVRITNQESGVGNDSVIHDSCPIIHFKEPQRAVATGQSIVFYGGDRVIGGGVIDSVALKTPLRVCKLPKFAHVS